MTDAKEYSRGANAKLAGLEYDPGRSMDWRMGWLEERRENNQGPNIPDDWVLQTLAYRRLVLRDSGDPLAQGQMSRDAMRSAIDCFEAEMGGLAHWDAEALHYLLEWAEGLQQSVKVALDNHPD